MYNFIIFIHRYTCSCFFFLVLQKLIGGLLFLWLSARSSWAAHPPSPCPDVFAYEGSEPEINKWYGEISLRTDENLVGVRLNIELDRPSDLMVVSFLCKIVFSSRKCNFARKKINLCLQKNVYLKIGNRTREKIFGYSQSHS